MAAPDRYRPAADFQDPRFRPGFIPELWPLCDGQPTPISGDPDLHERRCLEFLSAYYQVNVLVFRLNQARGHPAAEALQEPILRNITQATQALDDLEDRYAPIGFYGEPTTSADGIHQDVHFLRPGLNPSSASASSLGSHVTVPGLNELPSSELLGPIQVIRWRHGKMDL